ncbi:hypothetical protein SAMN02799624_01295 [Paenibacillus sp. UNC496MF]|uniref:WGxxGxxG family protein n=1 Tax=Paenibacillus sp. UNC496MF TaxID=1502753 RepID=UPI0008E21C76|nr:WGxxGxxG family protein [Paenibacillus sp. UNC496MF]SFI54412.1 hypothetical protein SAMN02799624_01295 [Paenibacillus sp. UNC496MF]
MKKKFGLATLLVGCLAFMLGTGILEAHGTATNQSNNGVMNNQSYDGRGMNTNSYNATSTATGGNYRANAVDNDNDFDWGWLGLLGLIGLAGLRSRNHDRNPERS